ncbi:hypothetical protein N431DRAFT_350054, partial [Stipitochalara longipes BDJ]
LKMHTFIYLISGFLFSLSITVATAHRLPLYQKLPNRSISFSPTSQHPILTYSSSAEEPSYIRGTISVLSCGLDQPIPVTFSLSLQVCTPLVPRLPHIIKDLSQQPLSKHLDGISYSLSDDLQRSSLPIYLGANITEQLYRSKFVLSLSLKLSPLDSGFKGLRTPEWLSIIELLEQSVQEMDREAKERDGGGLGSVLVLEAEIEQVHVLAEWRLWRVVDGLAVMCES